MGELVDPEKLVSIGQVAHEFGYHPKYMSKLAAEGKIKAWRIGSFWVTTREAIKSYVQTNPQPGPKVQLSGKNKKQS